MISAIDLLRLLFVGVPKTKPAKQEGLEHNKTIEKEDGCRSHYRIILAA